MNDQIVSQYNCAYCGKPTKRKPGKSRSGRKSERVYCDMDCYQAHRPILKREILNVDVRCKCCNKAFSVSKLVIKSGNGKYCSEECRRFHKRQVAKRCVRCRCYFSPLKYMKSTGKLVACRANKTCSEECHKAWNSENEDRKRKLSEHFSGKNHPNWQGGRRFNYGDYRGPNWKQQREKALKRDNYKCIVCGMSNDQHKNRYGQGLHVNHIKPYHNINNYKIANKTTNLETLCVKHHMEREDRSSSQLCLDLSDGGKHRARKGYQCGENVHLSKLRTDDVIDIRARYKEGNSVTSIHKDYTYINRTTIYDIVRRKTWKHIP